MVAVATVALSPEWELPDLDSVGDEGGLLIELKSDGSTTVSKLIGRG